MGGRGHWLVLGGSDELVVVRREGCRLGKELAGFGGVGCPGHVMRVMDHTTECCLLLQSKIKPSLMESISSA